ncbi:MAG TPA: AraC family transcriptional regulator [Capsulimonadaceae bacterium]|jgi:AraC-like DNA-binding protein
MRETNVADAFAEMQADALSVEVVEAGVPVLSCPHSSRWRTMPFAIIVALSGGEVQLERDAMPPVTVPEGSAIVLGAGVRHCITLPYRGYAECRFAHVRVTLFGCVDLFRLVDAPAVTSSAVGIVLGALCEELGDVLTDRSLSPISRMLRRRSLADRLVDTALSDMGTRTQRLDGVENLLRIAPVLRYIEERIAEPVTCAGLASVASLSPTRFHEVFKSAAGVSPMEFVIGLRIRRAQELLLSTVRPVGEIGEAVGYRDAYHFSRQFHERCGVSPTEYRRKAAIWTDTLMRSGTARSEKQAAPRGSRLD